MTYGVHPYAEHNRADRHLERELPTAKRKGLRYVTFRRIVDDPERGRIVIRERKLVAA